MYYWFKKNSNISAFWVRIKLEHNKFFRICSRLMNYPVPHKRKYNLFKIKIFLSARLWVSIPWERNSPNFCLWGSVFLESSYHPSREGIQLRTALNLAISAVDLLLCDYSLITVIELFIAKVFQPGWVKSFLWMDDFYRWLLVSIMCWFKLI